MKKAFMATAAIIAIIGAFATQRTNEPLVANLYIKPNAVCTQAVCSTSGTVECSVSVPPLYTQPGCAPYSGARFQP